MTPRVLRWKSALSLWLFTTAASLACGGGTSVIDVAELGGPSTVRCQTTFRDAPTSVPPEGGRFDVTIVTERECSWTVVSDTPWVVISPTAGQGESTITISIAANPQGTPRTWGLSANGYRLSAVQDPAPCTYAVGTSAVEVAAAGGHFSVRLTTPSGCNWTASSDASWIRVLAASGNSSAEVGFDAESNSGPRRTGRVTVGDATVTVVQQAHSAPGRPTPPAPAPPAPTPAPKPTPTPPPSDPRPAPTPTPQPPAPQPPPPSRPTPPTDTRDKEREERERKEREERERREREERERREREERERREREERERREREERERREREERERRERDERDRRDDDRDDDRRGDRGDRDDDRRRGDDDDDDDDD